jgi:hypothetical protein
MAHRSMLVVPHPFADVIACYKSQQVYRLKAKGNSDEKTDQWLCRVGEPQLRHHDGTHCGAGPERPTQVLLHQLPVQNLQVRRKLQGLLRQWQVQQQVLRQERCQQQLRRNVQKVSCRAVKQNPAPQSTLRCGILFNSL